MKPALSQRVFRLFLRAYPQAYRARDAAGMEYAFTEQMIDARRRGTAAVALFWIRTVSHALLFGALERVSNLRNSLEVSHRAAHTPVRRFGREPISRLTQELRQCARTLARSPLVTAVAVLSLSLGIGANCAIFCLVHSVLLRPLPYDEPERLFGVWNTAPGLNMDLMVQAAAIHFTYVDEATVFESLGLWNPGTVAVTGTEEAAKEPAIWVSEGVLPALRIQPALGRRFSHEDDMPHSPPTILLDWGYWQTRFGGDPAAVGQTLRVDGRVREIIGVLPEGFRLREYAAIYLPHQIDRAELHVGNFFYLSVGRLRLGVTIDRATAELTPLIYAATEKFPRGIPRAELEEARIAPLLRPLKADLVGNVGDVLWVLLGSATILLLIACANVANLSLAKAEDRSREMAVRAALGASRGRLAAHSLLESLSLGTIGGALGCCMAFAGIRAFVAVTPVDIPRLHEVSLDLTVLAFTAGLSIVAGILVGVLPILRRRDYCVAGGLKEGSKGSGTGRDRHKARNTLVVVQVAMALVLLVGSGLMIRSFQALRSVHPGFRDPESVLTLRIDIPSAEVPDMEQMAGTHEQIARSFAALPGVSSVGLTSSVTMSYLGAVNDGILVEGFPVPENQRPPMRRFKWISPGYFETMRNPVFFGRDFNWDDVRIRTQVVVVTENFAREYWEDAASALGKQISVYGSGSWWEIVGVVGDIRDNGVAEDATATIYWPMIANNPWHPADSGNLFARRTMAYAVRSDRTGTVGLMSDIRQTVRTINSNLPLANVQTLEDILGQSTARTSFTLVLLGIAAGVALLLGAVGLYGVISYVVSKRTREIGVRIALGAQSTALKGMVLRQGLILAGLGVILGLGGSYATTRLMSGLLFGVDPVDPFTYATVAVALVGVALLASYLPARRASRVDPIEALRVE